LTHELESRIVFGHQGQVEHVAFVACAAYRNVSNSHD
jgi:hypothetical protein